MFIILVSLAIIYMFVHMYMQCCVINFWPCNCDRARVAIVMHAGVDPGFSEPGSQNIEAGQALKEGVWLGYSLPKASFVFTHIYP